MKSAWIALTILLVACSPPGPDPEIVKALADYDDAYLRITQGMKTLPSSLKGEPDFRGLTYEQEYAQRVMTPETRKHLVELRELAAHASNLHMANIHLGEARGLLAEESGRAVRINAYWTTAQTAPYWRKYWSDLFIANQEPVALPDPLLLSIEARMRSALDRGDFQSAADEARMLPPVLGEAMNRAAGNLVKARKGNATFAARRTPCMPEAPVVRTLPKAQVQSTEELESYYPDTAQRAGIEGTVVLRVNVNAAGCGKEVAIVVLSGVPELDQAALSWFETARFAPAWRNGKAVQSNLTFKVRFKIEEPESQHMSEVAWADDAAPRTPRK